MSTSGVYDGFCPHRNGDPGCNCDATKQRCVRNPDTRGRLVHTGAYAQVENWKVTEHCGIVGMFRVYVAVNLRGQYYTARWVHESARGVRYNYALPDKFKTELEAKGAVVTSALKARKEKPWKVA